MQYREYSESDLESETNFQQPPQISKIPNSNKFIRNNSIKNSNQQQQQQQLPPQQQKNSLQSTTARRRASDCSYYGMGDVGGGVGGGGGGASGGVSGVDYYGMTFGGQKRGSFSGVGGSGGGANGLRRTRSNKSTISTTSGDMSSGSGSTCSDGETTSSSSGQPNLPYPGFAEFSFKYLSQDARPRSWCLRLITNPYPLQNDN